MARKRRVVRPASTVETREHQLVSAAIDLAEQQILDGTASSQVVTHYLKLGSSREKLEQDRLAKENELLKEKISSLQSARKIEELYEEALSAMREYSGQSLDEEEYYEDYYVDE